MVSVATIRLCSSVFVIGILAGCGSKGGNGGGNHPPPQTVDDDGDATGGDGSGSDVLAFNVEQLAQTNNTLQAGSGKEPAWTVSLTVNGEEKAKLERAAFSQVSDAVKGQTLKRSDVLRFEITITDKNDATLVLATNIAAVAAADASLKSVWDGQCEGLVDPEITIHDGGMWTYTGQGGGQGKIALQICDFANMTLKPMVEIKPQKQLLEKKTVIYQCALKVSTSTNEIYTYTDTSCPYGYATEVGETAPAISVLKKFAPGEPLYTTNILVMDNFKLNLSNAGTTQLSTTFNKPPFGSHEGCHTQKVDVKYGTSEGISTARLTFKRQGQPDGSVIWMPQNSASWPSMAAVKNYYAQAGAEEKVHVYRICDWIPELEDVDAGNVISFAGG
jgi:hypothetical protein